MAFKVGQKVECVHDKIVWDVWDSERIVAGRIYTITAVDVHGDSIAYHLAEVKCEPNEFYSHEHFRPLVEDKNKTETGMSILYGLIKTKSEKELVE